MVCRRSSLSRSFVLAALRALHLDRSHVGDMAGSHELPPNEAGSAGGALLVGPSR
jgi:hypothetical protein